MALNLNGFIPLSSRVPRGSILGPLFFIIYINDLSQIQLYSLISLYGDDTKCFKIITSPENQRLLQEDLIQIYDCSHHSNYSFNLSKSHLINFSRNTPHCNCLMNGVQLATQDRCRNLGVMFTSDLS